MPEFSKGGYVGPRTEGSDDDLVPVCVSPGYILVSRQIAELLPALDLSNMVVVTFPEGS